MEITLTDDQDFFRDTTRRFLAERCPTAEVRKLAASEAGFERTWWRQGAELGWTSLLVAEEHGGGSISGRGPVDVAIVADAFGRHVAPGPLLGTNVVAAAISRRGTDDQRAEHLPGLLSGGTVAAWCLAEPAPHDRLGAVTVRAEQDGDGYRLTGIKAPVEAGAEADLLLISAAADHGPVQVLVPAGAEGLRTTPMSSLDLVRRFARVDLEDVRVGADAVLGGPTGAVDDLEHQLQLALVIQAAELVGAAEVIFDVTVEWAFDRYSFGRPLASYQELKHRFADMKTWLEASHGLAAAAAREVAAGSPRAPETTSVAKAYLGERLAALLQDCLQIHGGIGLTADHDLHLYLRRVTVDRATFGTPSEHRRRVASLAVAAA
jgi:alkylation response protein AidB-like acyl-CoA dehydrogenase